MQQSDMFIDKNFRGFMYGYSHLDGNNVAFHFGSYSHMVSAISFGFSTKEGVASMG
jgi:hypothetical protein